MLDLIRLTPTTKKAGEIVTAYRNAWRKTLADAYPAHYSAEKAHAFKKCLDVMNDHNGRDMKIIGANTYYFSCGCMGTYNGESGLIYFTHAARYFIPLEDREPMSLEEFSTRWQNNVSDNYKQRTAKALQGRTIASMEEAESILKAAEMFTILESLKLA